MKRIYWILALSFFMLIPTTQPEAVAQSARKEQVAKRRLAKRKVRRSTRRSVRRRVTRRAHVKYAALPRYGVRITTVPAGAVVIRHTGLTYYYHKGIFYSPNIDRFAVVKPAVGIRVSSLPAASIRIVVSTGTYHYHYGTYYRKAGTYYEVVSAPNGAMVDAIPEGYDVVKQGGTEYYVWNQVHYQEVITDSFEGGVGYVVVES